MALVGSTNAEKIWNFCKSKGMNNYGCAAVLSSFDCESGLNPKNLENQYERTLGFTDELYTEAIDSGRYTNFVHDCAGFGLAQWTFWVRKQNLLNFAKTRGASIADLEMQLDFFFKELTESFQSVLSTLRNASSVLQASNAMLLQYECPANTGTSVQLLRASYAQRYYDRFAGNTTEVEYTMGYIKVKKRSGIKLSEHFNSNEFDCHGSGCCSETIINEKLVEYLEKIREHFGKPITITSAYRCSVHNGRVGGATGSRHTKGDASDIVVAGVRPADVAKYAESIGIRGIGLYETSKDGYFVHIDTRDLKSFWYGQACAPRTTFGGAYASGSNSSSTNTSEESKNYMLYIGSTGNAVRALQEKLVKLGYQIDTDGIYGNMTKDAVLDYQKKNGLDADGIAGAITQKSIADAVDKQENTGAGSYTVRVTANVLNIRRGAGTDYPITGSIRDRGIYTITAEATGKGATKWGMLSNGQGWIALDYCVKGK